MEITEILPVTLTESAITEVKRLMSEPDFDASQQLRIGVKGGGCSGLSYVLGFDGKTPEDVEFFIDEVPIIMNKNHELYLYGMQVDWHDGLNSRGFTFNNPNASSSCGCGSSFAV